MRSVAASTSPTKFSTAPVATAFTGSFKIAAAMRRVSLLMLRCSALAMSTEFSTLLAASPVFCAM